MACTIKIAAAVTRDCANLPVAGVDNASGIVLINKEDLLKSGITKNATIPNALLDDIALNSGTQGYKLDGFKRMISYTNPLVIAEDSINGVRHTIKFPWFDLSAQGRAELNKVIAGQRFYIVLERNWKGTDEDDAFLFFGIEHGLELVELVDESEATDGVPMVTLGTPDGYKEPYLPHVLLDTDYATTKTAFNLGFPTA